MDYASLSPIIHDLLLLVVIPAGFAWLRRALAPKASIDSATTELERLSSAAVGWAEQQVVPVLRTEPHWQVRTQRLAANRVLEALSEDSYRILTESRPGGLDALVTMFLEAAVARTKAPRVKEVLP